MKKLAAALSGTIVEYYDYALYGFASVSLAHHFFPSDDSTVSLLKSLLVFSLGSLAKPAGAFFFSHLGDHRGRAIALRWSMLGIAVPTLIIGLLPSYVHWGWISTLVLILCRFFQGFLVSGEYDGVAIYIQEHISPKYACLGNSFLGMCSFLGIYLASLFIASSQAWFSDPWGWRLPFILGGIFGLVCLIFRRTLIETPSYKAETRPAKLFRLFVQSHWPGIFSSLLICGASGALYHFVFVFWPVYLQDVIGVWGKTYLFQTSHGLLLFVLCCPLAGYLADKFGTEKILVGGSLTVAILLTSMIFCASQGLYPLVLFNLLAGSLPFFINSGHVVLTRYISVKERYRCINIGHSMGSLLFSGSTPAISLMIWQQTHIEYGPLIYILGFSGCTLLGLGILKWNKIRLLGIMPA